MKNSLWAEMYLKIVKLFIVKNWYNLRIPHSQIKIVAQCYKWLGGGGGPYSPYFPCYESKHVSLRMICNCDARFVISELPFPPTPEQILNYLKSSDLLTCFSTPDLLRISFCLQACKEINWYKQSGMIFNNDLYNM